MVALSALPAAQPARQDPSLASIAVMAVSFTASGLLRPIPYPAKNPEAVVVMAERSPSGYGGSCLTTDLLLPAKRLLMQPIVLVMPHPDREALCHQPKRGLESFSRRDPLKEEIVREKTPDLFREWAKIGVIKRKKEELENEL